MMQVVSADLTTRQAPALLGVVPTTVRTLANAGELPCRRTTGGHRALGGSPPPRQSLVVRFMPRVGGRRRGLARPATVIVRTRPDPLLLWQESSCSERREVGEWPALR